jgi:hypothetical protein
MAVATGTAIALGVGAGALAGAMGSESEQNSTSGISLGRMGELEGQAGNTVQQNLSQLNDIVSKGGNAEDAAMATQAQRELADAYGQAARTGGIPGQEDIATGNSLAARLFEAQRMGMQQAFGDQEKQFARQSALMGRSPVDPILRAKLAQEQTRQSSMLGAQQNSLAMQLAMNQPMQRLGLQGQRAGILGGLATQAMANRQALLSLGSGVQAQERSFRLATGTRWGNTTQESGGGLQGALTGGLAGAGMGMSAAGMFGAGGFGSAPKTLDLGGTGGGQVGGLSGMNYGAPGNIFGVGRGY